VCTEKNIHSTRLPDAKTDNSTDKNREPKSSPTCLAIKLIGLTSANINKQIVEREEKLVSSMCLSGVKIETIQAGCHFRAIINPQQTLLNPFHCNDRPG
jgi:hypothetical protein